MRSGRATNRNLLGDPAGARDELLATEKLMVATYGDGRAELVDLRGYRCEAELALAATTAPATCGSAAATAEHFYPPGHPRLAWAFGLHGDALLGAHDYPAAIARLEQALAIDKGEPIMHAELTAYLALALHGAHRDPARAARLAADARRVLADGQHAELLERLRAAFR